MANQVRYGSDLERKWWVNDKLGQVAHMSFWDPYIGNTSSSIIYSVKDKGCSAGKVVIFDYSGKLTGSGVKGDEESCTIGEGKRKFSSKMTVEMYSWFVQNGTKFKACAIGDLNISQHGDSMSQLSDLWLRHKDQAIFDVLQGATDVCSLSHVYNLGCSFEWNDLMYIEQAAKRGTGLVSTKNGIPTKTKGVKRVPLEGYRSMDNKQIYLAVIDAVMSSKLRSNPKYQTIKMNSDVRGDGNALFTGIIGLESHILYVEAPVFFGITKGKGNFSMITDTDIEFSGLRRYAVGPEGVQVWEGQAQFDVIEAASIKEKEEIAKLTDPAEIDAAKKARKNRVFSRGLLLGAGAGQIGFGGEPDYVWAQSKFKKTSESMLEVIFNVQKTELTLEMGKDYTARNTDIDYGVIGLDMEN